MPTAFIRGDVELAYQRSAGGRIAAEGHCHTRRAYCAWCRGDLGRRGAALFLALKRASICCRFFAGIAGVYSETGMPMEFNACTDICFKVSALAGRARHLHFIRLRNSGQARELPCATGYELNKRERK